MIDSNLFEEMLATYPPEKREQARQVYHRFADGDSSNFFTQLFIVLDVYAHYAERIPQAVVEANQNALETIRDMREEIGLLAKTIENRDVTISNNAEKTNELCKITIAKCNETVSRIELMLKNLGSQVDAKAIVQGIKTAIENGIAPLLKRMEESIQKVEPTLEKINAAADRASQLWPRHIWKTALTAGAIVGLTIAILGIGIAYWQMKRHFDSKLADEIRAEKYTLQNNKDAFENLAAADVPVCVARSADSSGNVIPALYCLYIPNAKNADMDNGNGRIFFETAGPVSEMERLLDVQKQ